MGPNRSVVTCAAASVITSRFTPAATLCAIWCWSCCAPAARVNVASRNATRRQERERFIGTPVVPIQCFSRTRCSSSYAGRSAAARMHLLPHERLDSARLKRASSPGNLLCCKHPYPPLSLTQARGLPHNYPYAGGRVAQLGEHLLCKQGVGGSNPSTSTNSLLPFQSSADLWQSR